MTAVAINGMMHNLGLPLFVNNVAPHPFQRSGLVPMLVQTVQPPVDLNRKHAPAAQIMPFYPGAGR